MCCVSKHTGSYYCCIVDPFSPSRLLSVQDSNLFTGMITEKENPCMSKYVNSGKKGYVVYIKTSMLIVGRTGMLYASPTYSALL